MSDGLKNAGSTQNQQHDAAEALAKRIGNEPSTAEEVGYYYKTEGYDRVLSILHRGGVEVMRADEEFTADRQALSGGHAHSADASNPMGAFAKTLLKRNTILTCANIPAGRRAAPTMSRRTRCRS